MSEINLLPLDLSSKRQSFRLALLIRRLSLFFLGGFLLLGTLAVVYIVYLRVQINSSQNNQKVLSQNITNLEATEQKLFLTKDRISKIKIILGNPDRFTPFQGINNILGSLPADVSPYSVQINGNKSEFSVLSKSSLGMATFLNSLVVNGQFKNLKLTSFVFSPERGYLITLEGS